MVSIIIPSRNEKFLNKTIHDLLAKARGEIEILVVLEGYWPDEIIEDKRVVYIHKGVAEGLRPAINSAAAVAKGEYLMKIDAHCMVDEGFDVKLVEDCKPNWIVIPRRKRLDADKWEITEKHKPDVDYMYISFPDDPNDFGGPGFNGKNWDDKNKDASLKDELIVPAIGTQGSCWFMHKAYFLELELMDTENYGTFWNEGQELAFKSWLSGGQMMVNKKTWYAHLHKGKTHGRGYFLDKRQLEKGSHYTKKWSTNSAWHKQTKPFSWLIEQFMPMPLWPEDWKEQLWGEAGEPKINEGNTTN